MHQNLTFDVELQNPTDADIEKFIQAREKEHPVKVLLSGEVNISAKSIASLISSILDGGISHIQTNNFEFQARAYNLQKFVAEPEKHKVASKWRQLSRAGYKSQLPFGDTLQNEKTSRIAEGMGSKEVYWTNALSLEDMFSKAYQVRKQLQAHPGKTGSFSFLMPEDKIPAAIMLSSILTQNLLHYVANYVQSQPPTVINSAIAGQTKNASVPVSYVDGQYRITVAAEFERKTLGDILHVDATKYKRKSCNDGSHYIFIPENDLNQALGLSDTVLQSQKA